MRRLTIKKLLLASVACSVLTVTSASAADMPSRPMPTPRAPVYVPFFTWSGFYIGLNAGYGFGKSEWSEPTTGFSTGDFNVNGALVGGTLGYNWQSGSAVFGLETDIAWSNIKGSNTTLCVPECETRNTWLGTARGRIGYAFDRFLPYFAGGAAYGAVKGDLGGVNVVTKTQIGWTLGAGLEYAFVPNWTARLEYLYVDLGTIECPAASCGVATDISFKTNIVRGGVNYKF